MAKRLQHVFSLFLIVTMLSLISMAGALAADAPGNAPGGMPEGMGMPPGGGGPGGAPGGGGDGPPDNSPPDKAAIYIKNGAEDTGSEYVAGKYSVNIKSDAKGITIRDLKLADGDYTFNGIVATGARSVVTLDNCRMDLGVDMPAKADDEGGSAVAVDDGAIMYINNSDLRVDGASRYVTSNYKDGILIVNDSDLVSTGGGKNTAEIAEPVANPWLLISGMARANFSICTTKTYFFNSSCTAEGWGALSTDSSQDNGLDLYAYNTRAVAQDGGYGTYADFNCRVWLYGSTLDAAEMGGIISKDGMIVVADGGQAPGDVLKYNLGKRTTAGSVVTGGRNAVMMHAPDMWGQGKAAADCAILRVVNSTLATSRDLKTTEDYTAKYGKAIGAYVDYISGPAILVKSTSADISLENAKIESYNGVIAMTVLNSDPMGNYLAEGDGKGVKPISISIKDMNAKGDIRHMDYQRIMTIFLDNAVLKGAVVSGTMEDWNKLWSAYDKEDCNWVVNDSWNTFYGVQMTVKKGATWDVTDKSTLSSLTVENGGTIKGKVQVDRKDITPSPGRTYTGRIEVLPL